MDSRVDYDIAAARVQLRNRAGRPQPPSTLGSETSRRSGLEVRTMSTLSIAQLPQAQPWQLPSRGRVAMTALIIGESAIFTIFVVAYIFYIGKSPFGPTPRQILEIPFFNTVCLLSSSFTIWMAERSIEKNRMRDF